MDVHMRLSIRYQLLIPLFLLLLGIVGISTWTAIAGVRLARGKIETQVRSVARTLSDAHYPLKANVLEIVKGLSGAEYLLVSSDGRRSATLQEGEVELPPAQVDWQGLHLGPKVTIDSRTYFCSGVQLHSQHSDTTGDLYILYPEALWRDALWEAIRPPLILGGFAGLVAVALTLGATRGLGRRLQALDRLTRRISRGDFTPMPLSGCNDELHDLGTAVNEMAERLAQLQEAVQQNERLRLLGQVSGGLAHQLRNGVTGAMLAVQLHARECTCGAEPEALDVALRQLVLLESNLKRFLDLGKTESRRFEPCVVANLVNDVVALLSPQCRHTRTELRWKSPAETILAQGDGGQLGHLVLNMITNAVEAAGPGGWVEISLQRKEKCILEVSDSGNGPAPEIASRLFQPFATNKQGGVGLGLAVARQVAESHGGRIEWRRESNKTIFRIELPLCPQAEVAVPAHETKASILAGAPRHQVVNHSTFSP